MTLTLASVFAPLAFATGRTGRLFIEFALTLAGAVMVSGFIALTLSPMMCSLLLKHESKHSWLYNKIENGLGAMTRGYRRLLAATLRARWVVVLLWCVVLSLGALFFTLLKSELSPIEDRGVVFGHRDRPARLDAAIHGRPDQADRRVLLADSRGRGVHGDLRVPDRSRWQRGAALEAVGRTHQEAAADRRRAASQVRGDPRRDRISDQSAVARAVVPVDAGRVHRDVAGSLPELQRTVDRFLDEVRKYPGVQNLQIDLRLNTPEVRVNINRDKLSDVGVGVDTVGRTLETMLGGRQVTRFKKDGEQYDVLVQVAPVDRTTPADISDAYVRARDGSMVQLSNLVDVKEGVAPQSLNHFNRLRAVKITATLRPGYAIDEALKEMNAARSACCPTPRRPTSTGSRASSRSRAARSTSRSCSRCCSSTSCCRRSSRASSTRS
jgi:multidrug efflux pump